MEYIGQILLQKVLLNFERSITNTGNGYKWQSSLLDYVAFITFYQDFMEPLKELKLYLW